MKIEKVHTSEQKHLYAYMNTNAPKEAHMHIQAQSCVWKGEKNLNIFFSYNFFSFW